MNVSIHTESTCRACGKTSLLDAKGDTVEEAENWTDGLCPDCAEKRFLNPADKADHDNKIQRELDP